MRIDQLVPAYHRGDAIGDTAFHLKSFFLSQGFDSQIYCLSRDDGLEGESSLFETFPEPGPDDVTILHFALVSPLTAKFAGFPGRKILIHHNVTPPEFFKDYSEEMVRIASLSRDDLGSLAEHVDLALADSEFNRRELLEFGFPKAEVFPLFVDFNKYERPICRFTYNLFKDDRLNILFVGRIAPNKKIEDLIKTVFYFKKYISPLVRLIIVGKTSSLPRYYEALIRMTDEFYLDPDEICFTGHISDEEMYAFYRASDVFLSMSEHEGFGLPFMESMIFDLPIIAYSCTAVPYTLGEGGILINSKRKDLTAELIQRLKEDEGLRKNIIEGQRRRLREFRSFDREKFLLDQIRRIKE